MGSKKIFARNFDALRMHLADRVSGLLISLVMVIGCAVTVLFAIYVSRMEAATPKLIVWELEEEDVAGRGDHAAGFARDFAPPGQEEVEQIMEPTLQQSLEAMTDAVSSIAASLDTVESMTGEASKGSGLGDSRPPGPLGEGDTIPRHERWELKFAARNAQGYAKQLDYFKIELGAVGGGRKEIEYASNLSGTPVKRVGPGGKAEKRLYFMWRQAGPLEDYERQLMSKAGISVDSRLILKFLTEELEKVLATVEKQNAVKTLGRDVKSREYLKTIFECRPTNGGNFEWVVIEQKFRNPPVRKKK